MRIRTWIYFLGEAFKSIYRNGWMSLASVGVVVVTLFLLGSFMILNYNMNFLSEDIKSQIEIVAFVREDVDRTHLEQLQQRINSMPQTKEVELVSREEALDRLKEQLGEQGHLLEGYEDGESNPLRDSFEISSSMPEAVPRLAQEIDSLPGIVKVDYGSEVVDKLFTVTRVINWVGLVFMFALGASAMFLIANTIKLAVFSRRQEIMIMKSVGATDWFIRWPFIIEGLVLGIIGSLVPLAGLYASYQYVVDWVYDNVPFLPLIPPAVVMEDIVKILILLGVGLGILGSSFSIRRFLKV
ncbi:MAG: ABC transporter permease [Candidatus Syntrophonatronum acetioxidans]|uniref:Cell division protein FtsX n=1 Tax=Candidatus Syntrophonatronum acetioxidans TaxID=1795816 RepID=A0A424Y995_9FIRM|nr:MAG: ABC transporter permease [Candidatus Syntrophonatronum acetioxidans]